VTAAYLATWPLRQASAARRLLQESWPYPRLPRPSISVGNLALGGRGKTPMTAALAAEAEIRGLRVAILIRGYKSRVGRTTGPVLLSAVGESDIVWKRSLCDGLHTRPARDFNSLCGDEATWLAATCGEATVAIHPNRDVAASAVLEREDVDLFLLDDGFQAGVQRDLDLVIIDPAQDPPFERKAACREGHSSLHRADQIALIHQSDTGRSIDDLGHPVLRRHARCVRELSTGQLVKPDSCPPVIIAAAVGEPSSVASCAREYGLTVLSSVAIRDHGTPSLAQRRTLDKTDGAAVLMTEKDALGWAAAAPLGTAQALVLSMDLSGSQALATDLLNRLMETDLRA